jgi:hypothetical protein
MQWNLTQPWRKMKSYHLQVNGWTWRTSFWARLARLRRPKIICSPYMWSLDHLEQIQQCCKTWVTWQGENIYRRYEVR